MNIVENKRWNTTFRTGDIIYIGEVKIYWDARHKLVVEAPLHIKIVKREWTIRGKAL